MPSSSKTSLQSKDYISNLLPASRRLSSSAFTSFQWFSIDLACSSIIPLEIWDCPLSGSVDSLEASLKQFSSLVYFIDIQVTNSSFFRAIDLPVSRQDSFHQSIAKLTSLVMKAIVERPDINLEVFVHKVESMPEEYRAGEPVPLPQAFSNPTLLETFRMIQNRVADELDDAGLDSQGVLINYHLTSIFDHTIWEAFSRVIQRLIEPAQFLEDCLTLFCAVRATAFDFVAGI